MLRAAGIDWRGCTIQEEIELAGVAQRRLQAESALALLVSLKRGRR